MRVRSPTRASSVRLNWCASCRTRSRYAAHINATIMAAARARAQFVWYHTGGISNSSAAPTSFHMAPVQAGIRAQPDAAVLRRNERQNGIARQALLSGHPRDGDVAKAIDAIDRC